MTADQTSYSPIPAAPLTAQERAENATAIDRYIEVRCVSRGLALGTRSQNRRLLHRFLDFCNLPVWRIGHYQYDTFMAQCVLHRNLAPSTHRYYQSTIEGFFSYLAKDVDYQGYVQRKYGYRVENPITDDNRIRHRTELEHKQPHYALEREQLGNLFEVMERLRTDALQTRPEQLTWVYIERDRIAIALQYYLALRVSELYALNLGSFEPAPWARAELGRFGLVRVIGKGSRGTGPKPRMVPVTTVKVRALMEWYLDTIRPLLPGANATDALFLNCRGERLSRSHFIHQFKRYLSAAGIDASAYSTHALRRSGLTHDAERMDIAFARQKAGHVYEHTTQGYIWRPPEVIQAQAERLVTQSLCGAKRRR